MKGLFQKYNITKVDGSAVDKEAKYFVLRVDDEDTQGIREIIAHRKACQKALSLYMWEIRKELPELIDDLQYEWDIPIFDWEEQFRLLESRAIDMFFASTTYKPYTIKATLDNGAITIQGYDYNGYHEGQKSFYTEDLLVDNFQQHLKETEEKKLQELEIKAKAEKDARKTLEEKQEKALLAKLKQKYENSVNDD